MCFLCGEVSHTVSFVSIVFSAFSPLLIVSDFIYSQCVHVTSFSPNIALTTCSVEVVTLGEEMLRQV